MKIIRKIDIDLGDKYPAILEVGSHELNVGSLELQVSLYQNGVAVDDIASNDTITADLVTEGYLVDTDRACTRLSANSFSVNIANVIGEEPVIRAGRMLVECKITSTSGAVYYMPVVFVIHIKKSITEDAEVTPESYGTTAQILQEVVAARGTYANLSARFAADETALGNKLDDADGEIETNHLAASAVTTAKLADGAVTNAKLANGSVNGAKLTDSSVTSSKIADGAVTNAKLAASAVTTAKLANDSVDSNKLAASAVITATLADGAVTEDKISNTSVSTAKLKDNAVTTAKLSSDVASLISAVNSAMNNSDGLISYVDLDTLSEATALDGLSQVGHKRFTFKATGNLATALGLDNPSLCVMTPVFIDGKWYQVITVIPNQEQIVRKVNSVYPTWSADNWASVTVTESKLAASAVTTAKLADGAVTTGKIADGAVTLAKLNSAAYESTPTSGSTKLLTSGGAYSYIDNLIGSLNNQLETALNGG